ncbi:hypothetical protein HAX54_012049, partial [Datura stramonium]|nr:hypothetical protein [Datura stramonium]
MSSSRKPDKGKAPSTSRRKGKGKAKATPVPSNTRDTIIDCVPVVMTHYVIYARRPITTKTLLLGG